MLDWTKGTVTVWRNVAAFLHTNFLSENIRCCAVSLGEWFPNIRKNVMTSTSQVKESEKNSHQQTKKSIIYFEHEV